jgi:phosphoribosylformimino-5-aminoimidazole carboxamide ribotide isomerase
MLIIPAIDLRRGHCVRLYQGKLEEEEIYSKDPVFIAKLWQTEGAKRIHIIDLDGAFSGVMRNYGLIEKIRQGVKAVLHVGGGIRNIKTVQKLLKIGIDKIILGTSLIYNPKLVEQMVNKYKNKIMVSIDALNGKVAIAGWKEVTAVSVDEIIEQIKKIGIKEIVYTDIKKDGTLQGANFEALKLVCKSFGGNVIGSGGISSLEEIKNLKGLEPLGLKGIIIGKALYTEKVKLSEAIKIGESVS